MSEYTTMKERQAVIRALLEENFRDSGAELIGWKFSRAGDGFVVWFDVRGNFKITSPDGEEEYGRGLELIIPSLGMLKRESR